MGIEEIRHTDPTVEDKSADDRESHLQRDDAEDGESWSLTDTDLASIGMSREEWIQVTSSKQAWEAHLAERKQQNLELQIRLREEEEEHRRELDRKWEQKTRQLEALKPSGDIVEGARNYFEATDLDPDQLHPAYREAFFSGDEEGMDRYFEDQLQITPEGDREAIRKYHETQKEVMTNMRQSYRDKKIRETATAQMPRS